MEEEKKLYQSMNAELDKQIEQDMQTISDILKKNNSMAIDTKTSPQTKIKMTSEVKTSPLTDFERIEQQIMDDEVDLYQSMNAELDKQIAKDMEAIKNYLSKAGEKMDLAKRIEFFNSMDTLPATDDNYVTDHILYQHTPLGNIKWHECVQCDYRSTEKSKLKEHIVAKHRSSDSFPCPHCPYMTKRENDLQRHLSQAHKESVEVQSMTCKQCSSIHTNKSDLIKHMEQIHGVEMGIKCKQCSHIAEDQSSLKQHTFTEHVKLNISWYKCAQCAYRTVRKANLDRHIMYKHSTAGILF